MFHHVNTSRCIKDTACAERNTRMVYICARCWSLPSLSWIKSSGLLSILHKISLVAGTARLGRLPVRFADSAGCSLDADRIRQSCFSQIQDSGGGDKTLDSRTTYMLVSSTYLRLRTSSFLSVSKTIGRRLLLACIAVFHDSQCRARGFLASV